jgi:hypothetical protein
VAAAALSACVNSPRFSAAWDCGIWRARLSIRLRRDVVWDVSPESPYEVFKGSELRNKTLGLVGYTRPSVLLRSSLPLNTS